MARPSFFLEITTPERQLFSEEVVQVSLPTAQGYITVLAHHAALVGLLVPGEAHIVQKNEQDLFLAVSGGFIEIVENRVHILADTAERAEEIDLKRAHEAKERAEQLMKESTDAEASAKAVAVLEKQLARIRAAQRHQRHREAHHETPLT